MGKGKKIRKDVEMERLDEEDFMQELEADKEMRTRVNIYKSDIEKKMEDCDENEEDKDDDQKITLDELLDNLVLDAKPDVEVNALLGDTNLEEGQEGMNIQVYEGERAVVEGERAAQDSIGFLGREEALNIQAKDTAVLVAGNVWGKEFMDNEGKFT